MTDHEHHWHERSSLQECCECGAVRRKVGARWVIELPDISINKKDADKKQK